MATTTEAADVVIVGDGPGGLSAALFLAKKGRQVVVFGRDETPMHKARLLNYLGIDEITGSDFQERARAQVEGFGASLREEKVTAARRGQDGAFEVELEDGSTHRGRYLILAMANKKLLAGLGLDDQPEVDLHMAAAGCPGAYVVGWPVRKNQIQAIISAGDGAAAALDILSREEGEDVHDFDVVGG